MKTLKKASHKRSSYSKLGIFSASLLFSICTMQSAMAQVNLAQVPLFLKESVDSNLVFVYDDSGSMAWRYMPDNLSGKIGRASCRERV